MPVSGYNVGPSMVAFDWSISIPDDLFKGLVYAVAIATWREALRESRHLGAKLRGFRPETVPVRELDRLLLKGLAEEPEVRDLALERFAAENAGLLAELEALGPARAATELDRLLADESAARIFWAAFRGGDPWSAVRDAVLGRVREQRLDGAPLFPPRQERRPKGALASETPAPPASPAEAIASPAHPEPTAAELEAVHERLRKAERELARAREDRDRLRDEVTRLEVTEARLLADRERLERDLDDSRRARALRPTEVGNARTARDCGRSSTRSSGSAPSSSTSGARSPRRPSARGSSSATSTSSAAGSTITRASR
jgi:hypothetical protein